MPEKKQKNEVKLEGFAVFIHYLISFCLKNKFLVSAVFIFALLWGIYVAPFDWNIPGVERDTVEIEALPNIGINEQIVFTAWPGGAPTDVYDQITYPLTVALLGIPGVKIIRGVSLFSYSFIFIIFNDDVDFYWSRARILEQLQGLASNALPDGVTPQLGPDCTALGQVFWYTLEGLDKKGKPTGGWNLAEVRTIQDYIVRYALLGAGEVSDVASVGGYVKEYQVDVDPNLLRIYDITLQDVFNALKVSNSDVGGQTAEINKVEYIIRGLGYLEVLSDIKNTLVKTFKRKISYKTTSGENVDLITSGLSKNQAPWKNSSKGSVTRGQSSYNRSANTNNIPIFMKDISHISLGPAPRRGILDKNGAGVVGGGVSKSFGTNSMKVLGNIKKAIKKMAPQLPKKVLPDGTVSQISVVPFYDRTVLILKALGTLNSTLIDEILVAIIVIIFMVRHFRLSAIISLVVPSAILICFILMKLVGVTANIVALSGIAIAIGTIVDMGIVVCENILKHLDAAEPGENSLIVVLNGASEVGGALITSAMTTIIGFLPVFALQHAEGKMFKPLAFTKTFAIGAAAVVAITILPILVHMVLCSKITGKIIKTLLLILFLILSLIVLIFYNWVLGIIIVVVSLYIYTRNKIPAKIDKYIMLLAYIFGIVVVSYILAEHWLPLGPETGIFINLIFVLLAIGVLLFFFYLLQLYYHAVLLFCLNHKVIFLIIPLCMILFGVMCWLGIKPIINKLPKSLRNSKIASSAVSLFPGLGNQFMPALDEGAFYFMPSCMATAGIEAMEDILRKQDLGISDIPEIGDSVGKAGRSETALDDAPLSMIETYINYKSEYITDAYDFVKRYKFNPQENDYYRKVDGEKVHAIDGKPYIVKGKFIRDSENKLIPDPKGMAYRQWRPPLDPALNPGREYWKGIKRTRDIWNLVVKKSDLPGLTQPPMLYPIEANIMMVQSGMNSKIGVVVYGPDLQSIQDAAYSMAEVMKKVDTIIPETVFALRVIGKPYIDITIDRKAVAQYGITIGQVQDVITTAIGGKTATRTVQGLERNDVRVRYQRELHDNFENLENVLVAAPDGARIPLPLLTNISYEPGPQSVLNRNTSIMSYIYFANNPNNSAIKAVKDAMAILDKYQKEGKLKLPKGVYYEFIGDYQNQLSAAKRLRLIVPIAMIIIFIVLYLQFKSFLTALIVYLGILVSWSGGFIMVWLYGQQWFLDFSFGGVNFRDLFNLQTIYLSVAVWVGFLALFGIAANDGVIMATYIREYIQGKKIKSKSEIHEHIIYAGKRRVRPCLMTTACTILALLPILTSKGVGADIMIPMAIPIFGGLVFEIITMFVVPTLGSLRCELKLKSEQKKVGNTEKFVEM
ncbi:MAG: efflux RND transporter permease subunit [bacterium]|nr:efflux RND transporter permease subunit [bacterium]